MPPATKHPLESAFLATDYEVDGPSGRFVIRIGELCDAIPAGTWAYITACNPRSRRLPDDENDRRMRQLEAELRAKGFQFWRGQSRARDLSWPPEASLLVLDISREQAIRLGQRLDQWAIVFGKRGHRAELVWILDGESGKAE